MKHPLKSQVQQFIHLSKYARWQDGLGRREQWDETVARYISFFHARFPNLPEDLWGDLYQGIYNLETMPSMRSLMTAGPALDRDNAAGYNCAALAIDKPRSFDVMLYLLMCGCGVGFSVERQFIAKLPEVPDTLYKTSTVIVVRDSKVGWAIALKELISLLYSGQIPEWDTTKVRPAGSRLMTFGGRASGPQPLIGLFEFAVALFKSAAGRKLTSVECHDLCCKIADIVVVGGVRRSALLSLSNLSDDRMRHAKSGQWWVANPQRSLANNSVCYTERPEMGAFMREWTSLYDSKSGERGIFNREAANRLLPERRRELGYEDWLTNPCSEILLRNAGFCNLTETVVRAEDTFESLLIKVRRAAIMGTLQATLSDFRYLPREWAKNCEEERLLGVSLTGIMDSPLMSNAGDNGDLPDILQALRREVVATNVEWSERVGIRPASATTCVKPSGTVSLLVNSAAGIHPRYSPYYIRTFRADVKDPLAIMMRDQGVPCEPDLTRPEHGFVFSFPVMAPESAVLRDQRTAKEQLELWKIYQLNWTEHKPSITVYVKEKEWMGVGAWVWDNFDILSGVSFLPHSDHSYKQAPYQEISQSQYEDALAEMPEIDWSRLSDYEKDDETSGSQELACTGGSCEL